MSIRHTSYTFLIAILMGSLGSVAAQPVLTADNTVGPLIGGEVSITDYTATTPADLTSQIVTGENVTWDFSGTSYSEASTSTLHYYEPPFDAGLPGRDQPEFADANFVQEIYGSVSEDMPDKILLYNYSTISSDGILQRGFSALVDADENGTLDTVSITFDPPEQQLIFPVSYGDNWESSYTQTFHALGMSLATGSITQTYNVAGWGTLVTPDGSVEGIMISESMSTTVFGITQTTDSFEFLSPLASTGKTGATRSYAAHLTMSQDGSSVVDASYSIIDFEGGGSGTAAERKPELPSSIKLGQNYPNPFNPGTMIPFTLEQTGPVTLSIHDVLGRRVETLVDGVESAGTHEVAWDASRFPSGIYQVTLRSGDEVRSRLVTLQK